MYRALLALSIIAIVAILYSVTQRESGRPGEQPGSPGASQAQPDKHTNVATQATRKRRQPPLPMRMGRSTFKPKGGLLSLADMEGKPCLFGSRNRCVELQPLLLACDEGDGDACHRAARMVGETPPRDALVARALLGRACKANVAAACTTLEREDRLVSALRSDEEQHSAAVEMCANGDRLRCLALMRLHRGEVSKPELLPVLSKMCELGYDRQGCVALALHGTGELARAGLKNACDMGSSDGCYLLARDLLGMGVDSFGATDLEAADAAYARACDLDPEHEACAERERVQENGGFP